MRLEVRGIRAGYGDSLALNGVDLVVPSHSAIALLGPNGAGKTTLLSTISGLLKARGGQVLLDGVDVTGASSDARTRLGLCHVTEGRSVFPSLTVRENLHQFARGAGSKDGIDRAVAAFPKLGHRMGQLAGTMSGGEQQMLALARAYVGESPLVLLDEVSMGLAPNLVDEIFEFIRMLAAEGRSLLIVEQYVAKALSVVSAGYILARGRIVFAGEPAELRESDVFAHYVGESV